MKRVLLTALLLLSPLSWAHAQGDPAQRIQAARQRASQVGIPVALLDNKVAEGRAKGVPADRIAAAVERRLASLERARTAMNAGGARLALTGSDLSVGADALEAGVDAGVLGRLARAAAADRRAVAIAVLTELVSRGLSSEQALARVTAALANGAEALRQLPGEAQAGGANGNASATGAAASARRGPPDVRGPANAAAHGGRAGAGGPPSTVPGPGGKGRGRGQGQGHGKP
ncbi:MAG TPA: hypothetical protein VFJ82_22175 [Longimicrobium sp.]|nr:hypothetical protein [Longimicrobium sp.]